MIEEKIKNRLQEILGLEDVELEVPERKEHGDFSTNIAMQIFSSKAKEDEILRLPSVAQDDKSNEDIILDLSDYKSSRQLAEYIASLLERDQGLSNFVRNIEVAGPGFINFWIKNKILMGTLSDVLKDKEGFGKTDHLKGKKVMFEYGDANTHKLPHIGHLFSYIFGDSMTHILEANGAELFRASYQGDVGLHVAKCLWAFKKEEPKVPEELAKKVQLLQKMYQQGNQAYAESEEVQKEVKELNKSIYEQDPDLIDLWKETRQWSIDYYKQFEERLGINYDRYYYESEVYGQGIEIVEKNLDSVFKKSEGAIIFEGSKYGLHDRVFLTKYGTPTYEAKDLYLQELKRKEWPMDKLIITTAHEQNEYFKVVFKALETLDPSYEGVLNHIGFGMVGLTSGKMSSRTGNVIRAIELVELVVDEIKKVIEDREDLSDAEKAEISETVGIGAVKYYFLKSNPVQDIKYDIEQSVSIDGNSGPYLQYTYARIQSVLEKVKGKEVKEPMTSFRAEQSGVEKSSPEDEIDHLLRSKDLSNSLEMTLNADYDLNEEEELILRQIVHYSGTIIDAAKNYSPNLLANYLYELAQKYNTFYNKHRIVDAEEGEEIQYFRIVLTAASGQVLKNGLGLLGIEVPEKM